MLITDEPPTTKPVLLMYQDPSGWTYANTRSATSISSGAPSSGCSCLLALISRSLPRQARSHRGRDPQACLRGSAVPQREQVLTRPGRAPPVGVLRRRRPDPRHPGILVADPLQRGGVFDHEAVRPGEVGVHVVAGTVPPRPPQRCVPVPHHPAGAAHVLVDVPHLERHVVEP